MQTSISPAPSPSPSPELGTSPRIAAHRPSGLGAPRSDAGGHLARGPLDTIEPGASLQKAFWQMAEATGLRGLLDAGHARQVRREAQTMVDRLTGEAVQSLRSRGPSDDIQARFEALAQSWGRYHETSVGLCEYGIGGHSVLWWALDKQAPTLVLFLLRLYNQRRDAAAATPVLKEIESLLQAPPWADTYAEAQSTCLAIAALAHARKAQAQRLEAQAHREAVMQVLHEQFQAASSQMPADFAPVNTLLEGECGEMMAQIADPAQALRDPFRASLPIPIDAVAPLLAATSDLALNRLLHYRMPPLSALPSLLLTLPREGALRLLLLYADVLREQGINLDHVAFSVSAFTVAQALDWREATSETQTHAEEEVSSLDSAFDACEDSTDSWDTASSDSDALEHPQAPASSQQAQTPARSSSVSWAHRPIASSELGPVHTGSAQTSSLRDVARLFALDEAVIWFDTDGQAPAGVRLERYAKPLVDLSPI